MKTLVICSRNSANCWRFLRSSGHCNTNNSSISPCVLSLAVRSIAGSCNALQPTPGVAPHSHWWAARQLSYGKQTYHKYKREVEENTNVSSHRERQDLRMRNYDGPKTDAEYAAAKEHRLRVRDSAAVLHQVNRVFMHGHNPQQFYIELENLLQSDLLSFEVQFRPPEFAEIASVLNFAPPGHHPELNKFISWLGNAAGKCVSLKDWSEDDIKLFASALANVPGASGTDNMLALLAKLLRRRVDLSMQAVASLFTSLKNHNRMTPSMLSLIEQLALRIQQRRRDELATRKELLAILEGAQGKLTKKGHREEGDLVHSISELVNEYYVAASNDGSKKRQSDDSRRTMDEELLLGLIAFIESAPATIRDNRNFLNMLTKIVDENHHLVSARVCCAAITAMRNKSLHFEESQAYLAVVTKMLRARMKKVDTVMLLNALRHCNSINDTTPVGRDFFEACAEVMAPADGDSEAFDTKSLTDDQYQAMLVSAFRCFASCRFGQHGSSVKLLEALLDLLEKSNKRIQLVPERALDIAWCLQSAKSFADRDSLRELLRFLTLRITDSGDRQLYVKIWKLHDILQMVRRLDRALPEVAEFIKSLDRFTVVANSKFDQRHILQCQQILDEMKHVATANASAANASSTKARTLDSIVPDMSTLRNQIEVLALSLQQAPPSGVRPASSRPAAETASFANKYEDIFYQMALAAFQDKKNIRVTHNELLFGHEADIVVRVYEKPIDDHDQQVPDAKHNDTGPQKNLDYAHDSNNNYVIVNIELDGGRHYDEEVRKKCENRDRYLTSLGVKVVRWNISADENSTFGRLNEGNNFSLVPRAFRSLIFGVPDKHRHILKTQENSK
jgi:hypothetical protein